MIKETAKRNNILLTIEKIKSSRLTGVVGFSILTAIAAQIAIPVQPVPFTMQTVLVVLAGAFLGAKRGAYSQILYITMGALGLPVFANGSFGAGILMGPTGGYLLAFPVAAYLTGLIIGQKAGYIKSFAAFTLGEAVIILSGLLFLNTFYIKNLSQAITLGASIFSIWSVAKVVIAATVFSSLKKSR